MLVRLLFLRWLSPTIFRVALAAMLLLLGLVACECLYLMFPSLTQPSRNPPIHFGFPARAAVKT
jgi:hypothetical protein